MYDANKETMDLKNKKAQKKLDSVEVLVPVKKKAVKKKVVKEKPIKPVVTKKERVKKAK